MDLIYSVRLGDVQRVRELLETGEVDVNFIDGGGLTPLMRASIGGHTDIVSLLMENGADTEITDTAGDTAISYSLHHPCIMRVLLEGGANPNVSNLEGFSPLHHTASWDMQDIAREISLLLEYGAIPDAIDNDGVTPLIQTIEEGEFLASRLLLEYGANPNGVGIVPLVVASNDVDIKITHLLLELGANPNSQDPTDNEKTALMSAAQRGSIETVRLLLHMGADTRIRDSDGMTAYDLSKTQEIRDLIDLVNMKASSINTNRDRSRSYMEDYGDLSFSFR